MLACHIKNDKLIIENEYCGAELITLSELENNLALDELKGIILICDQLPTNEALHTVTLPIIFIPELLAVNNLSSIWFQLFKKQSTLTLEQNCLLWNISEFYLGDKQKSLDGQWLTTTYKLPAELSKDEIAKFIGRTQDLEQVSLQLFRAKAQNECLTILGTGGLGKTSLVKKLAYEYNERKLFDCGVFFIDCEHLTSYQQFHRHIADAFDLADAVDVIEHINNNPELGQGERLIIIDNAESLLLLAEKPNILSLIGHANQLATLIITSRERLNIASEATYQLRDFVADEALQLFESKAKRQFTSAEALFLKEHILKEYLDHNPLAISLVAGSMVYGKNIEELRDDLKKNFFELTQQYPTSEINPADRNIDRRNSIYNSIEYSYRQLTESEKEALIKLSYFPDGIDLAKFKKLTEQDAKARGKTPIKDSTVKVLQDKSLIQTNQQHIRLHPLVARFAKNKVNPAEEANYLLATFEFQLSFINALAILRVDYDLSKRVIAKKICQSQINNFCFMLEKLNPKFKQQDILNYTQKLTRLLSELDIYKEPYESLKISIDLFKNDTLLHRYLEIELLFYQYYLGRFDSSYKKLQNLLSIEQWLALDHTKQIENVTFSAASAIYGNEGLDYEEAVYDKNKSIKSSFYSDSLFSIGVCNLKLAQVCLQDTTSLYVKWTAGALNIIELSNYLTALPPKAHIRIAKALTLKAKLIRLDQDEISKIVVVNPYTQGVKFLLQAMHSENTTTAKRLFQQALPELQHIKYAYTEALLEYATWLHAHGDAEFDSMYNKGLASAKKYHYRFLQHGFLQIKSAIKTPYNEENYPLPNDDDFNFYIDQLIKYCIKINKSHN